MTIETHLESFRINFPLHKVWVDEDQLLYTVSRGTAKRAAQEANEKINDMGLPLVAIANKFPFDNTFIVKSIEKPDI